MNAPHLRRVAIARTDLLGELVLTLTLARQLREADPAVDVAMIVAPGMEELIALCPDVTEVITHRVRRDAGWWLRACRLGLRLRAGRYDAILIANPTKEAHVAAWLSGIPLRIGYDCKGGPLLLTHTFPDERPVFTKHETQWNAELLTTLGISGPAPAPRLSIGRMAPQAAAERWRAWGVGPDPRMILMHPWASKSHKCWPLDRYQELARQLASSDETRIVIIGGAHHHAESEAFNGSVINLTGRTSLSDLALLMSRATCLVSNDTGPVHVAAAMGTPAVVLFGTQNPVCGPARWGPWGQGHTVIWKPSMDAISIEEVMHAVQRYLPESPGCVTSAAS